eukprot:scaffold574_cov92-Isochrysis_galbana.AAC.5
MARHMKSGRRKKTTQERAQSRGPLTPSAALPPSQLSCAHFPPLPFRGAAQPRRRGRRPRAWARRRRGGRGRCRCRWCCRRRTGRFGRCAPGRTGGRGPRPACRTSRTPAATRRAAGAGRRSGRRRSGWLRRPTRPAG